MNEAELEVVYQKAVSKLPLRAPIFLPTERVPMEKRIEGVQRVDHIYKNTLDAVYRPKLRALREKYSGSKRCFIIGNGPSLNDTDLEALKDEVTFAVNGFFLKSEELSWTPTYYVVEDHLVAEDRLDAIKNFKGPTKLFPAYLGYCFEEAKDTIFYDHRPRVSYPDGFDFSTDASEVTYTGCTVTFSCMQLAHYMGFEEIYLIGVDASYEIPDDVTDADDYDVGVLDMKSDDPNHFHPDYFGKGFRWHDPQVHKMIEAYKEAQKITEVSGRRIYNATVGGKLEVFDRVEFDSLFLGPRMLLPPIVKLKGRGKEYPRVLIYDITLSGDGTATGEVKSNVFQDWPSEQLGQFYSTGKEQFGWSNGGKKIVNVVSSQDAIDIAASFKPDVILYRPVLDNLNLHKAAMNAILRLDLPFITWFMDDWPEGYALEDTGRFAIIESDLDYLIAKSDQALVIGDMMAKAYETRYGRKFIPLANGVNKADWSKPVISNAVGRPFTVRYAGSLAENMTLESLLRVAEAVEVLSQRYNVVFEIKTNQLWHDLVKLKFRKFTKTSFLVETLSVEDYRAWLGAADTLVIAYNFDTKSKKYTQYSIANKLPETLASGAPVLAHGPEDVATIAVLKEAGCAQLVTKPHSNDVVENLEMLINSVELRQRLSQHARSVAFDKFDLKQAKAKLQNIIVDCHRPKPENVPDKAIILGNGPSMTGFDFSKFDGHVVFGMNSAYRYWDQIGWYPDYYSCLDLTVGLSHKSEIRRLIENSPEYGIQKFLLRDNLIAKIADCKNANRIVSFEQISAQHAFMSSPTVTTGSHTAAWAATLGYKHLFLMGIDCNYVEVVDGAVKNGIDELIIKKQKDNPNYFFEGYQKVGDRYKIPNPDRNIHLQSWREIKQAFDLTDVRVLNASVSSKVDVFDFCRFEDIERGDDVEIIEKDSVLTSSKVFSDFSHPREAGATFDETFLIFKMFEGAAPGVMIDVGAHHGGSADPFVQEKWSVYCQEPDINNRAKLVSRLGDNSLVKIDPRAVGETPETGRVFYSSDESTGISGLLAFRDTHQQSAIVDVTTVKEILVENSISHVDFLKIDVEGYDWGVLKGVPWDDLKPDVVECEFEDAKTKHLGHTWRDICEYLVERDYTVYVSEWHPIIRYGIAHEWRALKKYPCDLEDKNAWGNLLAFKTDPGEAALSDALGKVVKFRNKNYEDQNLKNTKSDKDYQPDEYIESVSVASQPYPGPAVSSVYSRQDKYNSNRFSDKLRRKNPILFRVAQIGSLGVTVVRQHLVFTILGLMVLCILIFGPIFIDLLKPFALYFWITAAGLTIFSSAFLGLSFANIIVNRIAVRERGARQALKSEILHAMEHQKKRSDQFQRKVLEHQHEEFKLELEGAYKRIVILESKIKSNQKQIKKKSNAKTALKSEIDTVAKVSKSSSLRKKNDTKSIKK